LSFRGKREGPIQLSPLPMEQRGLAKVGRERVYAREGLLEQDSYPGKETGKRVPTRGKRG